MGGPLVRRGIRLLSQTPSMNWVISAHVERDKTRFSTLRVVSPLRRRMSKSQYGPIWNAIEALDHELSPMADRDHPIQWRARAERKRP